MEAILSAAIGAVAVVLVGAVPWFWKRASREGRLILRIASLGTAYNNLPVSPEKDLLGKHLLRVAADLNAWLNPETARTRLVVRVIWYVPPTVAWLALVIWYSVNPERTGEIDFWQALGLGAAIGTLGVSLSSLIEARAGHRAAERANQAAKEALDVRAQAFRAGKPISGTPTET